jgi:hypothetical protein
MYFVISGILGHEPSGYAGQGLLLSNSCPCCEAAVAVIAGVALEGSV